MKSTQYQSRDEIIIKSQDINNDAILRKAVSDTRYIVSDLNKNSIRTGGYVGNMLEPWRGKDNCFVGNRFCKAAELLEEMGDLPREKFDRRQFAAIQATQYRRLASEAYLQ